MLLVKAMFRVFVAVFTKLEMLVSFFHRLFVAWLNVLVVTIGLFVPVPPIGIITPLFVLIWTICHADVEAACDCNAPQHNARHATTMPRMFIVS
jgi:hypothetical protein